MPPASMNQARKSTPHNSVIRRQDSRFGPPSRAFAAQAMTSASFGMAGAGEKVIAQFYLPSQGTHPNYQEYNDVRIEELDEDYRDGEAVELVDDTHEQAPEIRRLAFNHQDYSVGSRQQQLNPASRPRKHQEYLGHYGRQSTHAGPASAANAGEQGRKSPYSQGEQRGAQASTAASRPIQGTAPAGTAPPTRPRGAFPAGPGAQRASKLREVHNASPDPVPGTEDRAEPVQAQEDTRPAQAPARAPGRQDMYEQYLRETKKSGKNETKDAEGVRDDGKEARLGATAGSAPFRTPAKTSSTSTSYPSSASTGSKLGTSSSSAHKSTPPTSVDSSSRMEYSSPVAPGGDVFGASIAGLDEIAFDGVLDGDMNLALYGATSAVIDIGNDADFDFLGTGIKAGAPVIEEQPAEPEPEPTLFRIDSENTALAKAYKDLDLGAMWRDRIKAQTDASVKLDRKGVADLFEHWNDVVTNAIKNRLDILVQNCNTICAVKNRAVDNAIRGTKRYTSTGESLSGQCSDLHLATSGRKMKRLNDGQPQAIIAAQE